MGNEQELTINGVTYVPKGSALAEERDGKPFVIVRTYSAGVFAGYLESREGREAVIKDAIRIWYWKGAASLSQLATEGAKCPDECKFGVPVDTITVTEAIEILSVTEDAKMAIKGVKPWKID